MSNAPEFEILPDQASLKRRVSRRSIVTSLRGRTSRLFGRSVAVTNNPDTASIAEDMSAANGVGAVDQIDDTATTNTDTAADNINTAVDVEAPQVIDTTEIDVTEVVPQPVQAPPVKTRRSWFNSVGARFHRQDRTVLKSSDSGSHYGPVELEDASGMTNRPPPSLERPRSPSPISRRLFGTRRRFRLHSLPNKLRRSASVFCRSSSSLSDKGKENAVDLPAPPRPLTNAPNTGSWSSFRSGVQRAVRGECCRPPQNLTLFSGTNTHNSLRDGRRQLPFL